MNALKEHRRKKMAELKKTVADVQAEIATLVDDSAESHIAANYPYVSAIRIQFDDRYDGAPSAYSTKITLTDGSSYDVSSGYTEPGYEEAVQGLGHAPDPGMLGSIEEIMREGIDARWAAHNTHRVDLRITWTPDKLASDTSS